MTRFEQLVSTSVLPEAGPAHFAARRALWNQQVSFPPLPTEQSPKLLELLDHEGTLDSDALWHQGVDKIWKGVTSGGRLKRRLPMKYLVRIISLVTAASR